MKDIEKILADHTLWAAANGGNRAHLEWADLREADLRKADLRDVYFLGANLRGVNLRGARLQRAFLGWADLEGADLEGADLEGADLEGANLEGADLEGANLEGTNLRNTAGNGREIKSLRCGVYHIAYTATHLQIGCEGHPIDDWWEFSDEEIDQMDPGKSLEWWKEWKSHLRGLIKESPAVPTGTEG
jgi:hypothetical protein